jgi:WD40 repeat protein
MEGGGCDRKRGRAEDQHHSSTRQKKRPEEKTQPSKSKAAQRDTTSTQHPSSSSSPQGGFSTAASASTSLHVSRALLLVGTYHSVMAGLVLRQDKFLLKFSTKHHVGCVNAVAVTEKYLASSGTDERLHLFTAKDKGAQVADLGSLAPASEVTCMAFPSPQFLVCGCVDGSLAVFRSRDWESVLAVRVHDKAIQGLALHPREGVLAATVALDRFIALIDMTSGKLVTKSKLPLEVQTPHAVAFSPCGNVIAVATAFDVLVYDTLTLRLIARCAMAEKQPPFQIHGMAFAGPEAILVGAENSKMYQALFHRSILSAAGKEPSGDTALLSRDGALSFVEVGLDLAGAPDADVRHPRSHEARVRSIVSYGDTVISADTTGVILCWTVRVAEPHPGAASSQAPPIQNKKKEPAVAPVFAGLVYRCSANCRGRVTTLALLPQETVSV